MRDYLPEIISIIVIVLLVIAVLFGACTVITQHDEKLWNDGHCDDCGGNWRYEQAIGHRFSTSYIYVCEKCGKRIEVDELRNEVQDADSD